MPNPFLTRKTGAASGVPGTVHAMFTALEKYGTFHPRLLLTPVIQRAKDGWLLSEWSHKQIEDKKQNLVQFPSSAALYLDGEGNAVPVGMS